MTDSVTDLFNMTKPNLKKYEDLVKELEILGIESPNVCYQCSKCTSGCEAMKLLELEPHSVMASAKAGFIDEIMQSDLIWECVGCYKCKERCPQKMSPVELMYIIKNWCVFSGKQLPGEYQRILQGILSKGFIQDPLDVRDNNNNTCDRESLGLPKIERPLDQKKFTEIISKLAMEGLREQ
jgi:heterodisulfide reductase subunit C